MAETKPLESREIAELWLDTHEPSTDDVLELIVNIERETLERAAQVVENEPLGYITEQEHAKLENFTDRVIAKLRRDLGKG